MFELAQTNIFTPEWKKGGAMAAAPAGGPPQPHPPNPADAFAKASGAISPALDRQGTVCRLRSSGDLANHSSDDLATAVPPPLERR